MCNGKDDDCDGVIDNVKNPPQCALQQGVCQGATQLCAGSQGFSACDASDYYRRNNNYELTETKCDGLDNDCDGQIDQDKDGKALSRSCYEGTPQTRGVGACKDGIQTCENGQWGSCRDQVRPIPERCGNNIDDDCNGIPDSQEAACLCWGAGKVEELLVRNTIELDRAPRAGSTFPAIFWARVESVTDSTTLVVDQAGGFEAGDVALLINMQGSTQRVGTYELVRLLEITGTTIKLPSPIEKTYGATDNTDLAGQKIRLVRVPSFKRVIVDGAGELTVAPWDGDKGGLLVMQVDEFLRIANGGRLHVDGKGYRGAAGAPKSGTASAGEALEAFPSATGGRGGENGDKAAGGGGGAAAEAGTDGSDRDGGRGSNGGSAYITTPLMDRIFLGGGGGAGGVNPQSSQDDTSGAGGAGGGAILIWTRTLNLNGVLSSRGAVGKVGDSRGGAVGGGGGGAGGSIAIITERVAVYEQSDLSAQGGAGGASALLTQGSQTPVGQAQGGAGGAGKIELRIGRDTANRRQIFGKELSSVIPLPVMDDLPAACR
jgi:hypothetical protein